MVRDEMRLGSPKKKGSRIRERKLINIKCLNITLLSTLLTFIFLVFPFFFDKHVQIVRYEEVNCIIHLVQPAVTPEVCQDSMI